MCLAGYIPSAGARDFEDMNTSPNQPLEATGVSARDWPWSFRFAPSVLAGASACSFGVVTHLWKQRLIQASVERLPALWLPWCSCFILPSVSFFIEGELFPIGPAATRICLYSRRHLFWRSSLMAQCSFLLPGCARVQPYGASVYWSSASFSYSFPRGVT